ncbi:7222_t:CDS:2 [Diversispora eburnea]|uniref:7222_t:CDS:1 n=1 Tax=Diversispora eburnea TaxID=1213867 RepID=A0A9N9BFR4_9GLOM|nr:7222_t:CDS:2 [Diversispora eburnea]
MSMVGRVELGFEGIIVENGNIGFGDLEDEMIFVCESIVKTVRVEVALAGGLKGPLACVKSLHQA